MSKIVEIENLSKKYLIPHEQRAAYSTLVDTVSRKAKQWAARCRHPFSKARRPGENYYEELWSLKDINATIDEGDRIGIIGQNGAGKSTLLKILSRVTEPTTGRIKIRGRVSSLLEVGTGFHPELTGRENIYLNGAILGMSYQEIKRKFDEIVNFAEIEKFLDCPVKQFSSGMYTRLGFAIAAHLDPDLLIIDEALAVGDIKFQEKCLKKLGDLSTHGRTIIFVSHDIGSVLALCNKGLYLEKGTLKESGPIDHCVNAYMRSIRLRSMTWEGNEGDEHIRFYKVSFEGGEVQRDFFYQGENAKVDIEYEVFIPEPELQLGLGVWNQRSQLMGCSYSPFMHQTPAKGSTGRRKASFKIDTKMFHEGDYSLKLECHVHNKKRILSDQISLKLQIYKPSDASQLIHFTAKDGIFLGNTWEL